MANGIGVFGNAGMGPWGGLKGIELTWAMGVIADFAVIGPMWTGATATPRLR